jgi:4-hydroxy-tetrahydrodipicolinate synthase
MTLPITGVFCAAATPLDASLAPDHGMLAAHCRRLLATGCDGIALLGTTGEANSFSVDERRAMLEAVLAAGITPDKLLPGTGVAAMPETISLTRHALSQGVTTVVMLPPYYYKGVSDDGLFAAYAGIIEGVNDPRLRIVLYHIPQMSGIALSHELIAKLRDAFPETVVGIKDSAGDIANMLAMVERFPGFSVLAGADPLLLPLLRKGGAGSITATSNVIGGELATVFAHAGDPGRAAELEAVQARIVAHRTLSTAYAQIPTVKAMVAARTGEAGWCRVRPPLVALSAAQQTDLAARFAALETAAEPAI